jgi:hypothetical protein
MPTPTFTLISRFDIPTGTANFTFSSIPQTYQDLVLVANLRNTGSGWQDGGFTLNGSPSASGTYMGGTGTGDRGGVYPGQFTVVGDNFTAGYYAMNILYLPAYAQSVVKCYWTAANMAYSTSTMYDNQDAGVFPGYTTAVSSISVPGPFVANSSASLYGIKKS